MSDIEAFPGEKDVCPKCERVYVHADGHSCDVVRERWIEFTIDLEGGVPNLYADIRNLITIAYGNLCDSPAAVALLPMVHPDFSLASASEKVAAYHAVKNDPRAATRGYRYAATISPLRLTSEGMANLALAKFDDNDRILRSRVADWDTIGACARCALHSLAWACGPHCHFPKLFNLVNARDFDGAAVAIHMNEITPEGIKNAGLVPRNVRNKILMRNAALVHAFHLDPDTLDWTHDLAVADAKTQPSIEDPVIEPILHLIPDTVTEAQRRDDE